MKRMRVAFDLDNTLLKCGYDFPVEAGRATVFCKWIGWETLRRGTLELIQYLQDKDWEVWIYTTSYRSPWRIRMLFALYGIWLGGVINQDRHNRQVRTKGYRSSKYPPQFGIDLLIDDSEGVWIEAKSSGYHVVLVKPEDEQWVAAVKEKIIQLKLAN